MREAAAHAHRERREKEIDVKNRKLKHVLMVEDVPASNGKEARSYWTKIGVAEENADGSWSIHLSAVPVSGRMQIRDPAPVTTGIDVGGAQ